MKSPCTLLEDVNSSIVCKRSKPLMGWENASFRAWKPSWPNYALAPCRGPVYLPAFQMNFFIFKTVGGLLYDFCRIAKSNDTQRHHVLWKAEKIDDVLHPVFAWIDTEPDTSKPEFTSLKHNVLSRQCAVKHPILGRILLTGKVTAYRYGYVAGKKRLSMWMDITKTFQHLFGSDHNKFPGLLISCARRIHGSLKKQAYHIIGNHLVLKAAYASTFKYAVHMILLTSRLI